MKINVVVGEDDFSEQIAKQINAEFIKIKNITFLDSEVKLTLETEEGIKDNKILVVFRSNRFAPNINESIIKIFFITSLLKEIGAKEINLLAPYMFYSRQDKQFLSGEIKSFSNMANLYESLGFSNIFTINSHLYGKAPDLQSFFKKIKINDLSPAKIFSEYLKTKDLKDAIIIGPGKGADRLIEELANLLHTGFEGLEKERDHKTQEIVMKPPKEDLKNRDVIIYDDVAASGGTIIPAFELAKQHNPKRIFIVLPHLITKGGIERIYDLGADEVITTDSFNSEESKKFTELTLISLISEYVKNM
jgi:ribose-phosphate pyrophosphokinase